MLYTVGHEYIKNIWFMRRISTLLSVTFSFTYVYLYKYVVY